MMIRKRMDSASLSTMDPRAASRYTISICMSLGDGKGAGHVSEVSSLVEMPNRCTPNAPMPWAPSCIRPFQILGGAGLQSCCVYTDKGGDSCADQCDHNFVRSPGAPWSLMDATSCAPCSTHMHDPHRRRPCKASVVEPEQGLKAAPELAWALYHVTVMHGPVGYVEPLLAMQLMSNAAVFFDVHPAEVGGPDCSGWLRKSRGAGGIEVEAAGLGVVGGLKRNQMLQLQHRICKGAELHGCLCRSACAAILQGHHLLCRMLHLWEESVCSQLILVAGRLLCDRSTDCDPLASAPLHARQCMQGAMIVHVCCPKTLSSPMLIGDTTARSGQWRR
eukprot:jgi/Ulvmu1/1513/UM011_0243.1